MDIGSLDQQNLMQNTTYQLLTKRMKTLNGKTNIYKKALFPSFVRDFINLWVGLMNTNDNEYICDVAFNELKWLIEVTDDTRGGLEALKVKINGRAGTGHGGKGQGAG